MSIQLPGNPDHDLERQGKFEVIQLSIPDPGLSPSLPSQQKLRQLSGVILGSGALLFAGTGGWTSARTPAGGVAGDYTITFSTAFAAGNYVPTLTPLNAGAGGPMPQPSSLTFNTGSLRFLCYNAAGALTDVAVSFTIYGQIA